MIEQIRSADRPQDGANLAGRPRQPQCLGHARLLGHGRPEFRDPGVELGSLLHERVVDCLGLGGAASERNGLLIAAQGVLAVSGQILVPLRRQPLHATGVRVAGPQHVAVVGDRRAHGLDQAALFSAHGSV